MSLQLRLPGGIEIQFSDIDTDIAYKRVADVIQAALSPFKPLFDLVDIAILIKETLEKAIDIPTDPSAFIEKLSELTVSITKLSQYIPQIRVPFMVKDTLGIAIAMTDQLLDKVSTMELLLSKKVNIEINVPFDQNLHAIADLVQVQYDEEVIDLKKMIEPLVSLMKVIGIIASLINFSIDIPISIEGDDISNIKEALELIKTTLGRIFDNVPG